MRTRSVSPKIFMPNFADFCAYWVNDQKMYSVLLDLFNRNWKLADD